MLRGCEGQATRGGRSGRIVDRHHKRHIACTLIAREGRRLLPRMRSRGKARRAGGMSRASAENGEHRTDASCVLVVDPEALIRWALREHLVARGFRVVEASEASEARERAQEADVVVLDVRLRDGGELDLASELKRTNPGRPVILTTPDKSPELERRAASAGLQIALEKPFDLVALARLIEARLQSTLRH